MSPTRRRRAGVSLADIVCLALIVHGLMPKTSHNIRRRDRPARRVMMADNDISELADIKAREAHLQSMLDALRRVDVQRWCCETAFGVTFNSQEKARVLATRQLRIGIVGFGRFGQFLATAFRTAHHDISVLSRSDRAVRMKNLPLKLLFILTVSGRSCRIGCGLGHVPQRLSTAVGALAYFSLGNKADVAEFMAQSLDVVVLAVSIVSFEETLQWLQPSLVCCCLGIIMAFGCAGVNVPKRFKGWQVPIVCRCALGQGTRAPSHGTTLAG